MKKIIIACLVSFFVFGVLNFFYSNLNDQVFNYPVVFRFDIPYIHTWIFQPITLGFSLIVSFCFGVVFMGLLQALPGLFRYFMKNRRPNKEIEASKDNF